MKTADVGGAPAFESDAVRQAPIERYQVVSAGIERLSVESRKLIHTLCDNE